MAKIVSYVSGVDRNNPDLVRSHLYANMDDGQLWPMCDYAWNRSDGDGFSVFRGHTSKRGKCKLCEERKAKGLKPIYNARPHKTRWL